MSPQQRGCFRKPNHAAFSTCMLLLAVQENRDRTGRRKDVDREIREEREKKKGILVLVCTRYQDSITNKFKVHLGEVSHK